MRNPEAEKQRCTRMAAYLRGELKIDANRPRNYDAWQLHLNGEKRHGKKDEE